MANIELEPVRSGYNLSKINGNFDKIAEAVNNALLHRTGGDNTMLQDLDMNGKRILNAPVPTAPTDLVRAQDVENIAQGITGGVRVVEAISDLQEVQPVREGLQAYIRSTGQSFVYVIDEGETDGQWAEKDQLGDDVDVTAASHLTLAQAQASDLKVGQYVIIKDRYYSTYQVLTGQTVNNIDVLTCSGTTQLKLVVDADKNDLQALGINSGLATQTAIVNRAIELFRGTTITHETRTELSTGQINVYPETELKGSGMTYSRWQFNDDTVDLPMFVPFRPAGYAPTLHQNVKISGFTFIGSNTGTKASSVSVWGHLDDVERWEIEHNEFALFKLAVKFNEGSANEAYFNLFARNKFASCITCYEFGGAANRNTFDNNTYLNCDDVYDFSASDVNGANVSETNTFVNENLEGCKNWAEWITSGFHPYKQSWINCTIENPSSNAFTCTVKDPGRQEFIGLSLIPSQDASAVDFYGIGEGLNTPSLLLGNRGSSSGFTRGLRLSEPVRIMDDLFLHKQMTHGTGTANFTLAAGGWTAIAVSVSGADVGDFTIESLEPAVNNVLITSEVDAAGQVNVAFYNPTGGSKTINSTVNVVVLKNRLDVNV